MSLPPPPPPANEDASQAARALEKQERLARVYDAEVGPVYGQPFADLILSTLAAGGAIDRSPRARIVEVGCATGALTAELARRFDGRARITALDEAPFVSVARAKVAGEPTGRITFEVGPAAPLALPDASADLAVSNLAAAESADPAQAVRELARVLAPGGEAVLTTPLRGSWAEFLDIYRDVLMENGTSESVAGLDQLVEATPDGPAAAAWLEAAGLVDVELTTRRWEILFKSAREFFFAPLVELGPLSRWKRVAGRGEKLQDVFFFTKEAIDTYFRGRAFPVTIVGAALRGRKPG
jgi:ubiquinone/menaquinone biosynthesis C-methylase UbiE